MIYLFHIVINIVFLNVFNCDTDNNQLDNQNDGQEEFYTELAKSVNAGQINDRLDEILSQTSQGRYFLTGYLSKSMDKLKGSVKCSTCDVAMNLVIKYNDGGDNKYLYDSLLLLCPKLTGQNKEVCKGMLDLYLHILTHILTMRPNITSTYACSILLQHLNCYPSHAEQWSVNIDEGPKKQIRNEQYLGGISDIFKMIHITDLHYDSLYLAGGNAECDYPICARINQGEPRAGSEPAGTWGDYRKSDTPWSVVRSTVEHTKSQNPDYILFTGDIIPHNLWETNVGEILDLTQQVMDLFKAEFGYTQVLPILGNHDTHPCNIFAPSEIKDPRYATQWVYDSMAQIWAPWLTEDAIETVRKGGFYTILLRPNFRIVALNSNVCYTFNFWLLYDSKDPGGQLQWLADVLLKAEANNEFVHILSHVPPGEGDCLIVWQQEYRRIVDRFSHIIKGQFNGHTHYEELRLFYDLHNETQVINAAFNGGGINAFTDVNPNYRIYMVDSDNYDILDYQSWIYNISEANQNPAQAPRWFNLYSFRETYGVNSLRPRDLEDLITRMSSNQDLVSTYFDLKMKRTSSPDKIECTGSCLEEELCHIVTSQYADDTQCAKLDPNKYWWF